MATTGKAERTRNTILDAAMGLFNREGYDRTTMRAIAREAGVSVGNAYYYFGSKEHLIQAFYDQMQVEHAEAAERILARDSRFEQRLLGVLHAWLDVAAPHHEFAGQFFRNAADPHSPLSPFSPESAPAREASIALFTRLVQDSDRQAGRGAEGRAAAAAVAAPDGRGAVLGLRREPRPAAVPRAGRAPGPDRRPDGEALAPARRPRPDGRRRRPGPVAAVMTTREVAAAAYVAAVAGLSLRLDSSR